MVEPQLVGAPLLQQGSSAKNAFENGALHQ
jgi:hypothetical protein